MGRFPTVGLCLLGLARKASGQPLPEPPSVPPTAVPADTQPPPHTAPTPPTPARAEDFPLPPPPPPPEPTSRPAHWRNSTAVGASLGLGAPYGYLGTFLAWQPARWSQLELGGGWSGGFGPSVGFMARFGIDPGNDTLATLGLGFSSNFTNFDYVTNCTNLSGGGRTMCNPPGSRRSTRGTVSAHWLNLEVAEDFRTSTDFGLRAALGAAVLFNTSGFPEAASCASEGAGRVPCHAAVAHGEDRTFWVLYAHVDLYYLVVNGTARER